MALRNVIGEGNVHLAQCECDQICCTWCEIHGDTGVDIDAIARDHEARLFGGLEVQIVRNLT